jgi:hypothetical protein
MQLYAPEPNFETILTAISTGFLLYMYPASASPQNNQYVPYAYYLNHDLVPICQCLIRCNFTEDKH